MNETNLKDVWDRDAVNYAKKDLADVTNTMDLPGDWLPEKGDFVLEGGCGTGGMMKVFSKKGARTFGIDISRNMLVHAKSKGGVVQGDVRRLPFKDGSFDYISSLGVIEHFTNSEDALLECKRVVRRGGKIFLNVPNRCSFYFPLRFFAEKIGLYSLEYSKHFTLDELIRLGANNGLEYKDWKVQRFVPKEAFGMRRIVMSWANILDHLFALFNRRWGNFVYVLYLKK